VILSETDKEDLLGFLLFEQGDGGILDSGMRVTFNRFQHLEVEPVTGKLMSAIPPGALATVHVVSDGTLELRNKVAITTAIPVLPENTQGVTL
jgi:hypothetical protein